MIPIRRTLRASKPTVWWALATLCLSCLASGATFRVDQATGSDGPTCGTEPSPCASIQQGVNRAASGDTVLVAEGTYTYTPSADPCAPGETGVVCVKGKHLTILGGYASGNWVDRDPAANPTVIDGQNTDRGILAQRASPGSPAASVRLEGFTITRGRAGDTPGATEDRRGGGLKAGLLDSLVLRDVVFDSNVAAGADTISNDGGNGAGGGASISNTPSLPRTQAVLERVTFKNNQALGGNGPERGGLALGGGLFIDQTNLQASDLTFDGNSATAGDSPGDGLFQGRAEALGGGLAILSDTSALIQRFTAVNNSSTGGDAAGEGGTGGGGAFYFERSDMQLRDGTIRGNSSLGGSGDKGGFASGGGVTAFATSVVFDRVALLDNHATGGDGVATKGTVGGGGAYLNRHDASGVSITMTNSIVAGNQIALGTGTTSLGGGGAGLFFLGNDGTIVHSTFARNVLGSATLGGQAFSLVKHPSFFTSTVGVEDSLIAEHTSLTNEAAVKVQTDCTITFSGGLFAGNERDTNDGDGNAGSFFGLATVGSAASGGFVSPGPPNHDYHITGSSAAVDQATSSTIERDFDDTFRASPRDIGADEHCSLGVKDLVLTGGMVDNSALEEACETITASSYEVTSTGDLLFRAGRTVALGDGFQVATGGTFTVEIVIP